MNRQIIHAKSKSNSCNLKQERRYIQRLSCFKLQLFEDSFQTPVILILLAEAALTLYFDFSLTSAI